MLGKLENVGIRKVWKQETEFSDWLVDEPHLAELGEAIGMDLVEGKRETGVGEFSADIVANVDGSERTVIIENQYGKTDHDHLGKLITYVSGTNATVVVWIVEEARDEHRSAIQWLNENSNDGIGFFLVQIQLFRIGNSEPAPQFTVLERPNDWTKDRRGNGTRAPTKTQCGQQRFFSEFMDYAMERKDYAAVFRRVQVRLQHWLNLPLGSGRYHMSLRAIVGGQVSVEVYIPADKAQYRIFETHKTEIEKGIGMPLEWMPLPTKRASRIVIEKTCNWLADGDRHAIFKWLADTALAFRTVFPKYSKREETLSI